MPLEKCLLLNYEIMILFLTISFFLTFAGCTIAGKWGYYCDKDCHCKNNMPCSMATGACPIAHDCSPGWIGLACNVANGRSVATCPIILQNHEGKKIINVKTVGRNRLKVYEIDRYQNMPKS